MFSTNDVFQYAMSQIHGKDFDICIIDFLAVCSNISNEIKRKSR
jgi:hypothetical protein